MHSINNKLLPEATHQENLQQILDTKFPQPARSFSIPHLVQGWLAILTETMQSMETALLQIDLNEVSAETLDQQIAHVVTQAQLFFQDNQQWGLHHLLMRLTQTPDVYVKPLEEYGLGLPILAESDITVISRSISLQDPLEDNGPSQVRCIKVYHQMLSRLQRSLIETVCKLYTQLHGIPDVIVVTDPPSSKVKELAHKVDSLVCALSATYQDPRLEHLPMRKLYTLLMEPAIKATFLSLPEKDHHDFLFHLFQKGQERLTDTPIESIEKIDAFLSQDSPQELAIETRFARQLRIVELSNKDPNQNWRALCDALARIGITSKNSQAFNTIWLENYFHTETV